MDTPSPPPEYKFPPELAGLVNACEKNCEAGCCGIDAFVLSPLYVAAHMAAYQGHISDDDVAGTLKLVAEVETAARLMVPDRAGYICHVRDVNTYFTLPSLLAVMAEIRKSVVAAPAMVALSNELSPKKPKSEPVREFPQEPVRRMPPKLRDPFARDRPE